MNKILRLMIDSSSTISFDIFDTLIKRNCKSPKDIFKIIERKYNNNNETKIKNFYENRINSENKARMKTDKEEITLKQIYENMSEYSEDVKKELERIEIETEYEFCKKNIKVYEIYKYCKEKNKKIICTSDMYLTREILLKILNKNDINVDEIYVSSEYGKTKHSGNLFKTILNNNIKKKDILHIGDNLKSDFLRPLLLGIKAFKIKRDVINSKFICLENSDNNDINTNVITSIINNNTLKYQDYYKKIGYEILGPICCSFIYWLNNEAKEKEINNLLFCARDMKLIQEIYNIICTEEQKIKNSYFYVSRKSTFLPYLYANNNFKSFASLMPEGKRKMKIRELLASFNIDASKVESKLEEYGLTDDGEYDLTELKSNEKFKEFYEKELCRVIEVDGKEQFVNFKSYLEKKKMNPNAAVVDLGWHGTTQEILINILKYEIFGFYFGLYTKKNITNVENTKTFIFNDDTEKFAMEIYSFASLFEMIFSALHGSTLSYTNSTDAPYVLGNASNDGNKYIELIQEGAKEFAIEFSNYTHIIDEFSKDLFIESLIRIGIAPKLDEAKKLGEMNTENLSIRKFASPGKRIGYIINLKRLKKDFVNSEWKIGFLRRLFVIRLPYYKVYSSLKKLRDGERKK